MEILMNAKTRHIAAASAATALLATALPASSSGSLPVNVPTPPPLVWAQCESNPARDCALLRVPLNYANLAEGFIDLPVARRRANGTSFGPLVMNFGGPVSAGAFLLEGAGDENFTQEMLDLYDLVAVNARGMTDGVTCFDSQTQGEYWLTNHFTRSPAELDHLLALERAANERCLQDEPQTARHMSSD